MFSIGSNLDEYILQEHLGDGKHSQVWKCTKNGQNYAIKIATITGDHYANNMIYKEFGTEAGVMSQLSHARIQRFYEYKQSHIYDPHELRPIPVVYIVSEFAEGGDLLRLIMNTGRLSMKLCRHYFIQILDALESMHNKGFAHLDIKAENILLDENLDPLLADFDLSRKIKPLRGETGTKVYMPPEMYLTMPYDPVKADLFTLGSLLFCMLTGAFPFGSASLTDGYYSLIVKNRFDKYWKVVEQTRPAGFFSAEFKSLIEGLLAFNPNNRLTIEQVKANVWVNGPSLSIEELELERTSRRELLGMDPEAEETEEVEEMADF